MKSRLFAMFVVAGWTMTLAGCGSTVTLDVASEPAPTTLSCLERLERDAIPCSFSDGLPPIDVPNGTGPQRLDTRFAVRGDENWYDGPSVLDPSTTTVCTLPPVDPDALPNGCDEGFGGPWTPPGPSGGTLADETIPVPDDQPGSSDSQRTSPASRSSRLSCSATTKDVSLMKSRLLATFVLAAWTITIAGCGSTVTLDVALEPPSAPTTLSCLERLERDVVPCSLSDGLAPFEGTARA
jgi:uncharacterized protein YceK